MSQPPDPATHTPQSPPPPRPGFQNSIQRLVRSFAFGFAGLGYVIRTEPNMRIHCLAGVFVIAAGVVFSLAMWEWITLVFCIGLVIAAECMNTAFERLADRVCPDDDPLIRQAKDCGAATVLVVSLMASVVGGLLFVPRILTAAGW